MNKNNKKKDDYMKREDLRSKIIPTEIKTQAQYGQIITKDLFYLGEYFEYKKHTGIFDENGISATDYAKMNDLLISKMFNNSSGREIACAWLRDGYDDYRACYVGVVGDVDFSTVLNRLIGVCPSLRYELPTELSKPSIFQMLKNLFSNKKEVDIRKVKHVWGKTLYHTLQIGEYPKSKANEALSRELEALYNDGNLKNGINVTGRWFSFNGNRGYREEYAGKHCPEFEYNGDRYVRVVSQIYGRCYEDISAFIKLHRYSDGTILGKDGTIRWVKVEPISFIIRNWDDMPKSINPNGNGKATYFDLRAEEVIFGNLPFYPNDKYSNCTEWENSYIRGFLNGIDIREIHPEEEDCYKAEGGNFTGECNFLNEAFNLSRKPIVEYAIPDSEFEICDDAFNGCVSLKKLIVHPNVRHIGKRAFEGLGFKYVYKTEDGNLTFSQELLKEKDKYKVVVELEKLAKNFIGFDYNILVEGKGIEDIIQFSEVLTKNKFDIPYVYGSALIRNGKAKEFYENSYFKFFKKEFPNINEVLLKFPEEERLDFFKFANILGCFSTQKILDKNGIETKTIMAQKASLLLARLIKIETMRLRKLS